jgi:hypothetical protein
MGLQHPGTLCDKRTSKDHVQNDPKHAQLADLSRCDVGSHHRRDCLRPRRWAGVQRDDRWRCADPLYSAHGAERPTAVLWHIGGSNERQNDAGCHDGINDIDDIDDIDDMDHAD